MTSLEYYLIEFEDLARENAEPHKALLLLTVLDLIEAGIITENAIIFSETLRSRFKYALDLVRPLDDKGTANNPYFYMADESFWELHDPWGNTLDISAYRGRTPTLKMLQELHAVVPDDLVTLMKDPEKRRKLKAALTIKG